MQLNKEKRSECENLQAQSATAKSAASKAEAENARLVKDLASAKARVEELAAAVKDADASAQELQRLQAAVAAADLQSDDPGSPMIKVRRLLAVKLAVEYIDGMTVVYSWDHSRHV